MKNYNVKITGGGTIEEIKQALRILHESLSDITEETDKGEFEFEDSTLMTEISIDEE